jgi:hypothetical protein
MQCRRKGKGLPAQQLRVSVQVWALVVTVRALAQVQSIVRVQETERVLGMWSFQATPQAYPGVVQTEMARVSTTLATRLPLFV